MIRCSNCHSLEMVGVLYCTSCGAPLILTGETRIALNLLDHQTVLPVARQKELTLGRTSEDQPVAPDIDLSPYRAYEAGVSRLHAALDIAGEQVFVKDLGSANGTRLNGERIPANIPFPVANGDTLTLGKLNIRILIQKLSGYEG